MLQIPHTMDATLVTCPIQSGIHGVRNGTISSSTDTAVSRQRGIFFGQAVRSGEPLRSEGKIRFARFHVVHSGLSQLVKQPANQSQSCEEIMRPFGQLNPESLECLTKVDVPNYNRSEVTTGIVHFGLGNFHRAHQAMYLDALMNKGLALDWGICGIGVTHNVKMRDFMRHQSGLFTLVVKNADKTFEPRVIGSIHEYIHALDNPEAAIAKLASPEVRIVSLTVTEGGYNFNQVTGDFDFTNPFVVHDLSTDEPPISVFGLITAGLARRRASGTAPFTVMSCDNIPGNGLVARRGVLAFAGKKDPELAKWIADEVSFPCSMVDRITPVTTDRDRQLVQEKFGYTDGWPVMCEPFTQWVLEDKFSNGRPPLEVVGVQLVPESVQPYELMKLRMLNCSHQAMAYFGYLSGIEHVHEAVRDPLIHELLRRYMHDEAIPTLPPVPGVDLNQYAATLLERFANPEMKDTLARLCGESSDRIPKWMIPLIRENLAAGRGVPLSAAIVASWARYAEGVDEKGQKINVVDRLAAKLTPIALTQNEHPLAFIENEELFGDVASLPKFAEPYGKTLKLLKSEGAQAALTSLLLT